ncbi:hypothetical protein ACT3HK_10635 [Thermolongibacillus altinsuensis]
MKKRVIVIYMISLIFRHKQAFLPLPRTKNAIRQMNLSAMRFTFGIGMLLACRGGKKNLAAYGRKAVFYRDDKDMSETQLESI